MGVWIALVVLVVAHEVLTRRQMARLDVRLRRLEEAGDAVVSDDEHEVPVVPKPATCLHPPHQRQDASTLRKRQFFCHSCRATVPGE